MSLNTPGTFWTVKIVTVRVKVSLKSGGRERKTPGEHEGGG